MVTVTVKMPEHLHAVLCRLAKARQLTKSEVIRRALAEVLRDELRDTEVSALDLMRRGVGVVRSGRPDLGSNPDHLDGFGES